MSPFNDLIDFVVANVKPEVIATFRASDETHDYVYNLLHKEKTDIATPEERSELDKFMLVEHIVRMIKAKAAART